MRKKLLKAVIPFMLCLLTNQAMYAVEKAITVTTSVSTYATVEKSSNSIEKNTVNPATGEHTGLLSVFNITTNGTDSNYDLIITSKIEVSGGGTPPSAYDSLGNILFGHTTNLPTTSAVNNAKSGSGETNNVIAYGTNVTTTGGLTASFSANNATYGNCYVVKLNGSQIGTVTHHVLGSPKSGTYSIDGDLRGEYKSTITFTLVGKS